MVMRRITARRGVIRRPRRRADVPQVRVLTRKEADSLFDRQVRRHLGMSGTEFLRAHKAGQFKGRTEEPAVMRALMLVPLAGGR